MHRHWFLGDEYILHPQVNGTLSVDLCVTPNYLTSGFLDFLHTFGVNTLNQKVAFASV